MLPHQFTQARFPLWPSLAAQTSLLDVDICMEKAMAPHSSTLAWKIPRMKEPDGLQSMGSGCSAQASHCGGFSCGEQALGVRASVVVACGLKTVDSVVVVRGHVGSSGTRD